MIKTSELIEKLMVASEESCKCEDEGYLVKVNNVFNGRSINEYITIEDVAKLLRLTTDFSRFISMRTTCKVLQELGIIEPDVDVLNNDEFRETLLNTSVFKDCH